MAGVIGKSGLLVLACLLVSFGWAFGFPTGAPVTFCSAMMPVHLIPGTNQAYEPQATQSPYTLGISTNMYNTGEDVTGKSPCSYTRRSLPLPFLFFSM